MNKIQNKGDPDHVYIDINLYNQPDQIDDKPQFLDIVSKDRVQYYQRTPKIGICL